MASPPAKRLRRSKTIVSDDEDDHEFSQRLPTTQPLITRGSLHPLKADITSSPGKSPSKRGSARSPTTKASPRKTTRKVAAGSPPKATKRLPKQKDITETTKSLHSFFGRVSEEQRWSRRVDSPTEAAPEGDAGDEIEDDDASLDEAFAQLSESYTDTKTVLDRRKPGRAFGIKQGPGGTQSILPSSSQRFAKPALPPVEKATSQPNGAATFQKQDHRPWADQYAPAVLEDLAIHKKKVADVQKWLSDVLDGRNPSVCALQM